MQESLFSENEMKEIQISNKIDQMVQTDEMDEYISEVNDFLKEEKEVIVLFFYLEFILFCFLTSTVCSYRINYKINLKCSWYANLLILLLVLSFVYFYIILFLFVNDIVPFDYL